MQFKKRKTGKNLLTSNEYFQASLSLSLSLVLFFLYFCWRGASARSISAYVRLKRLSCADLEYVRASHFPYREIVKKKKHNEYLD